MFLYIHCDCWITRYLLQLLYQVIWRHHLYIFKPTAFPKHNYVYFQKSATTLILEGFINVVKSEDFNRLTVDEIIGFIRDDKLVAFDEEHVFEAVCHWIQWDIEKRRCHAYKLLSYVRLPHISPEYLVYEVNIISVKLWKNISTVQ